MQPAKSDCQGCGDTSNRPGSSRPDCCTTLEVQKDIGLPIAKSTAPESPVILELLPLNFTFVPGQATRTKLEIVPPGLLADGPPLYLRYGILLI